MKNRLLRGKDYVMSHPKKVVTNGIVSLCFIWLAGALLYHYIEVKRTSYPAARACDYLTVERAQDLLGDHVISVEKNEPVVNGDLAVSKCSYTDTNHNLAQQKAAAVAIQSALNDKGDVQNKKDFATMKSQNDTTPVKQLGDDAFFDSSKGQLDILRGHQWIILSYGTGEAPETSSLEQVRQLADKVLSDKQ